MVNSVNEKGLPPWELAHLRAVAVLLVAHCYLADLERETDPGDELHRVALEKWKFSDKTAWWSTINWDGIQAELKYWNDRLGEEPSLMEQLAAAVLDSGSPVSVEVIQKVVGGEDYLKLGRLRDFLVTFINDPTRMR